MHVSAAKFDDVREDCINAGQQLYTCSEADRLCTKHFHADLLTRQQLPCPCSWHICAIRDALHPAVPRY
jgi:hypothetical protein